MKTEVYTMIEYIKKFHQHTKPTFVEKYPEGSKISFAKEVGRTPSHVRDMHLNAANWMIVIKGSTKYLVEVKIAFGVVENIPN